MAGLDQIKQIFPEKEHGPGNQSEADQTAPEAVRGGVVADFADHVARARSGADGQRIYQDDAEIYHESKHQERSGFRHQAHHIAHLEIHFEIGHDSPPSEKMASISDNLAHRPDKSTARSGLPRLRDGRRRAARATGEEDVPFARSVSRRRRNAAPWLFPDDRKRPNRPPDVFFPSIPENP